jgi:hypothetical protein
MEAEPLRVNDETSFKAGHRNSYTGRHQHKRTAVVMLSLEESRCDYLYTCIGLLHSDLQ